MPRVVSPKLTGLRQAFQSLQQSEALRAARERAAKNRAAARRASGIRTISTIGGAIAGGVATGGSPQGIAFGAQAGSTAGGIISASRGDEDFPTSEVANTAISFASLESDEQRAARAEDTELDRQLKQARIRNLDRVKPIDQPDVASRNIELSTLGSGINVLNTLGQANQPQSSVHPSQRLRGDTFVQTSEFQQDIQDIQQDVIQPRLEAAQADPTGRTSKISLHESKNIRQNLQQMASLIKAEPDIKKKRLIAEKSKPLLNLSQGEFIREIRIQQNIDTKFKEQEVLEKEKETGKAQEEILLNEVVKNKLSTPSFNKDDINKIANGKILNSKQKIEKLNRLFPKITSNTADGFITVSVNGKIKSIKPEPKPGFDLMINTKGSKTKTVKSASKEQEALFKSGWNKYDRATQSFLSLQQRRKELAFKKTQSGEKTDKPLNISSLLTDFDKNTIAISRGTNPNEAVSRVKLRKGRLTQLQNMIKGMEEGDNKKLIQNEINSINAENGVRALANMSDEDAIKNIDKNFDKWVEAGIDPDLLIEQRDESENKMQKVKDQSSFAKRAKEVVPSRNISSDLVKSGIFKTITVPKSSNNIAVRKSVVEKVKKSFTEDVIVQPGGSKSEIKFKTTRNGEEINVVATRKGNTDQWQINILSEDDIVTTRIAGL